MSRLTWVSLLPFTLPFMPLWVAVARAEMPVSEALQKQQQAEADYYRALRKMDSVSTDAQRAALSTSMGPARVQLEKSIRAANVERMKKYGIVRGTKEQVYATGPDADLGEATFNKMSETGAPKGSEKIAAAAAAVSSGSAAATKKGGPSSNVSPPASSPEPEAVLDGSDVPRYLQFRGKKK